MNRSHSSNNRIERQETESVSATVAIDIYNKNNPSVALLLHLQVIPRSREEEEEKRSSILTPHTESTSLHRETILLVLIQKSIDTTFQRLLLQQDQGHIHQRDLFTVDTIQTKAELLLCFIC